MNFTPFVLFSWRERESSKTHESSVELYEKWEMLHNSENRMKGKNHLIIRFALTRKKKFFIYKNTTIWKNRRWKEEANLKLMLWLMREMPTVFYSFFFFIIVTHVHLIILIHAKYIACLIRSFVYFPHKSTLSSLQRLSSLDFPIFMNERTLSRNLNAENALRPSIYFIYMHTHHTRHRKLVVKHSTTRRRAMRHLRGIKTIKRHCCSAFNHHHKSSRWKEYEAHEKQLQLHSDSSFIFTRCCIRRRSTEWRRKTLWMPWKICFVLFVRTRRRGLA